MKPPEPDDGLDALFRENDGYIEDAGFTARVVTALPPRRRAWMRPMILFGAMLVGFALLAWMLPPLKEIFVVERGGGFTLSTHSLLILAAGIVVVTSLFWGLFAVVRWED